MKKENHVFALLILSALLMVMNVAAMTTLIFEIHSLRDDISELEVITVEPVETVEEEPEFAIVEEVDSVRYFDVPLDEGLQDHIFEVCEKYDVDPSVVVAIIRKESTFRDGRVGDNGRSYGLMQIQLKWHKERMVKLGCTDLLDPYQNITVGVDYLAELIHKDKGLAWALMAYNGGPSYANKQVKAGNVSSYARVVMADSENLMSDIGAM